MKTSLNTLQHHRGRATTQEQWVFGLVDVSYEPGMGYMEIVQGGMLVHFFRSYRPTSFQEQLYTLMSGLLTTRYKVYQMLPATPLSITLYSLSTQCLVCTQNIESYWNCVKQKFKQMKGVHLQQLPSYLDE